VAGDEVAETARTEAFQAARALPGRGWLQRIAGAEPRGTTEAFLAQLSRQVHARDASAQPGFDMGYDLETEAHPPVDGIRQAAHKLGERLAVLEKPLRALAKALAMQLDERADELDTSTRQRLDALIRSLERRAIGPVAAWRSMLAALGGETPPEFIDWFSVERIAGREVDMGMHRNWVDPTLPFARTLLEPAHGAAITSATLRDQGADAPAGWATAEARTGLGHFAGAARSQGFPSPFDYAVQTRILVITDLSRNDMDRRAAAYGELMTAAGGGAIGLFTSIARLRAIHRRLTENQGPALPMLLAQHADPLDAGTLVDIFREEEDACLLGTDAVRDGIDVPGRSLRLIVFDRVPWPRPSILHRERRRVFTRTRYDDMIARLRLKQAYGRLVRRDGDAGVFVVLDPMMPSRLAGAFPDGVAVVRLGLADAVAETRAFLDSVAP
jgi:ATP-dependent DNA helicase DinG